MNQTFQYQYRAKPWMDEVLAIREKYLPWESGTSVKKEKKYFTLTFLKHFVKKT